MLILNRKVNQKIIIGNDITVVVQEITTDSYGKSVVKLGIEAPEHVCVDRSEIRQKRIERICGKQGR